MPLTKIVAFLFIFLYVLPFLTALCCMFPVFRHICFAGMYYFTTNEYSLNFFPMPEWRGTSRGYAFSAVSLFAVPLLASMFFNAKYKVRMFPPGSFFYFLYYLSVVISGVNAIHKHQWGFEVYKMFWMYVTFLAAFNYLNNSKNLFFFVYVVSITLIILFLIGLNEKYRIGRFQIITTFPHQNSLSLYLELFGLLMLGVLMNEDIGKLLFVLTLVAFGGSVLLIIFTYSRGGLVVYFGGIAIVCALSILLNGFSMRRLLLMLIGLIVMLCIVGYALPRIILRFTKAPESSKNTRIALALASKEMANDYRLGVGANNYTEYSGYNYDYAFQANFNPVAARGAIVETIYLLVAAECGWYGMGFLILWFLYYLFSDTLSIFVLRKKPCSGIAIGIFGGLFCNYWHSTLEWSLKQYNNFAGQMILYALVGVIAVNRKKIKAAYQRHLLLEAERKRQERLLKMEKRKKRAFLYSTPIPPPQPRTEEQGVLPAADNNPQKLLISTSTADTDPAKHEEQVVPDGQEQNQEQSQEQSQEQGESGK